MAPLKASVFLHNSVLISALDLMSVRREQWLHDIVVRLAGRPGVDLPLLTK
jgi:hypothetical protein